MIIIQKTNKTSNHWLGCYVIFFCLLNHLRSCDVVVQENNVIRPLWFLGVRVDDFIGISCIYINNFIWALIQRKNLLIQRSTEDDNLCVCTRTRSPISNSTKILCRS